jgi:cell division protein YceG involved in septum cleavage
MRLVFFSLKKQNYSMEKVFKIQEDKSWTEVGKELATDGRIKKTLLFCLLLIQTFSFTHDLDINKII